MSQGKVGVSNIVKAKRQRKAHNKSRSGCINCRFRRVKCDEGKPSCQKCRSYMVPCNYSSCMEDLSVIGEQVNTDIIVSCPQARQRSPSAPTTPSPCSGALSLVSFDKNHDVILRFQHRTALTVGDEKMTQTYAEHVPRLAIEHEYLLHAVFATTLLHDRAIAGNVKQTDAEAYHLGRAAALFNKQLSSPSSERHWDALWATAIYLCAISVFIIDTRNPKEAWPLKDMANNLEWLELQAGLRVMWNITNVTRSGGVFARVEKRTKMNCIYPRTPQPGIDGLPKKLVDLCGLTQDSTPENDPYHAAVRHLTWLLPTRGDDKHMLDFMVFAGGLSNEFRALVKRKEPRALLLMAIWYSKLFDSSWWMAPRAVVECRAISLYLAVHGLLDRTFRATLALVNRACRDKAFDIGFALLHDDADNTQSISKTVSNTEKSAPTSMLFDMFWIS